MEPRGVLPGNGTWRKPSWIMTTCENFNANDDLTGNPPNIAGVIKLPIIRGIKQYKCMVVLCDLPVIMHCLGR